MDKKKNPNATGVQVLKQSELLGQQFSVYGTVENPLFLAKDVAKWIKHSDVSKMVKAIDEDEKLIRTLFLSGQNRDVVLLTEDGLYEVLMQSRKQIAKQFKKGVKEILKSIRKDGGYLALTGEETGEEIMAKAIILANSKIERLELKCSHFDSLLESKKSYPLSEVADHCKCYEFELRKKLFDDRFFTPDPKYPDGQHIYYIQTMDGVKYAFVMNFYNGNQEFERKELHFTAIGREYCLNLFGLAKYPVTLDSFKNINRNQITEEKL